MINYDFDGCKKCAFYVKHHIAGTSMVEEFCNRDRENIHNLTSGHCEHFKYDIGLEIPLKDEVPLSGLITPNSSDKTNSSYIRGLSDEELAVFLAQCIYDMNDYPNYVQEVYDWLHKPIELDSNAYSFAELAKKYIKEVH